MNILPEKSGSATKRFRRVTENRNRAKGAIELAAIQDTVARLKTQKRGKMKRRISVFLLLGMTSVVLLAGCGGKVSYKDGTFTGKSDPYESEDGSGDADGYGVVKLTIKNNAITSCEYKTYQPDGTPKDDKYGMKEGAIANKDFYNKAQKAVAACDEYASMLVQNGELKGIDSISGATVNYNEFMDAAGKALDQAKK